MSNLLARKQDEDVADKARAAVDAFRTLQPILTNYARHLSGKDYVTVECSATDNGSTDGKTIFFRPPIALGDNTAHQRYFCDRRDEYDTNMCPACAVREEVLTTIYHEIAHICFDSFATITDDDKRRAIEFAVREAKGQWADKIADRIRNTPTNRLRDYPSLVGLISQYLPFLMNCLEDARVNRALFDARPGVKIMFDADTGRVFREGFENINAQGKTEIVSWKQAPLNSQAMVGVFCKASGYRYDDWFHPKVVEALNDAQMTELIATMKDIKTAAGVYNLSFKVLARLRDLGFCGTPQDPDPEPEEETDDGKSDDSSGDSSDTDDDTTGDVGDSDEGNADPGVEEAEPSDVSERDDGSGGGDSESDSEPDSDDGDPGSGSGDVSPDEGSSDSDGLSEGGGESSDHLDVPQDAGGEDAEADDSSDVGDPGKPESDGAVADERGDDSEPGGVDERGGLAQGPSDDDSDGPDADAQDDGSGEGEDHSAAADSEEEVDTGADDGYGGTEVADPPMGEPDDMTKIVDTWLQHTEKPKTAEVRAEEQAIETAVVQGIYFTTPSSNVLGVNEYREVNRSARGWGSPGEIKIPEAVLQPPLMRLRRIFTDNQRNKKAPNKKSGKVNPAVLGRRAWSGDERLFAKRYLPGKKDYAVILSMDISGSTSGVNLRLEKRAVYAQAELLNRVGIPFVIVAHTAVLVPGRMGGSRQTMMEMYHVKELHEAWNDRTKARLASIKSVSYNLDGHALEFLRKYADTLSATDVIIMYYSDGKMPAENKVEELRILQSEIKVCGKRGYTLMGVGIRTDSPRAHGLDTVQVDNDGDLVKVVQHLEKRLGDATNR